MGSFDFEIDIDGSANAFPGDEVQLLSLDAEYPLPECLAELPSFPETIFGSASGLIYPGTGLFIASVTFDPPPPLSLARMDRS